MGGEEASCPRPDGGADSQELSAPRLGQRPPPAAVPDDTLQGAGVQPPIVNVSWMTFEIGLSWPVTIPGAVPLTRKAVSVARVFVPKKPGAPTSQSLMTRVRPLWLDTDRKSVV